MLVYVILCVIFFIIENDKWLLVHLLGEQDESAHLQFGIVNILRFQCFVNQHFLTGFFCLFVFWGQELYLAAYLYVFWCKPKEAVTLTLFSALGISACFLHQLSKIHYFN